MGLGTVGFVLEYGVVLNHPNDLGYSRAGGAKILWRCTCKFCGEKWLSRSSFLMQGSNTLEIIIFSKQQKNIKEISVSLFLLFMF
jgi:hypothetical protein